MARLFFVCISVVCVLLSTAHASAQSSSPQRQVFQVKGVVKEIAPSDRTVTIQHEAVTNYMPAMTMPFDIKDTNELRGIHVGDTISFQLNVLSTDAWIEHLTNLNVPSALPQLSAASGLRVVRDVDPLAVGDLLPEYHFTNQLGQAISTKDFLGQPFAFTFFFTRCPYPTFCPLLSSNFEATE